MRALPAKSEFTRAEAISLRAPTYSGRPAEGSGGHYPAHSTPASSAYNAPTLPDRQADYALLTEQCRARIEDLAPRQRDVLAGLLAGLSNKEIAHVLGISPRTIEIYRAGLMSRLKARTLAQALHIAFLAGLEPSDTMSPGAA